MGEEFIPIDKKLANIDATLERILRELQDFLDTEEPEEA